MSFSFFSARSTEAFVTEKCALIVFGETPMREFGVPCLAGLPVVLVFIGVDIDTVASFCAAAPLD